MELSQQIVAWYIGKGSKRLDQAIWEEYQRNGGKQLSDGKIRHLRRMIRRRAR